MTLVAYPAYESYKNSQSEWLSDIPAHWNEKRLKHLGILYAGIGGKSGEDFSKEQRDGFLPFVPFVAVANFSRVPPNFDYVRARAGEAQNRVEQGDLIFLMSSETQEDIARSALFDLAGVQPFLNSFCRGFRPDQQLLFPVFANYLLMAQAYRDYFSTSARGFTRINLKQEYILNAPLALPPPPEQRAIAAFLDEKCAKVDEAVRIKEEQIALLRERRQILIQQAVTRGLNPDAPMKHSGIDWVGRIPAHWEVTRLGTCLQAASDRNRPDLPLLSITREMGVIERDTDDQESNHNFIPDDLRNYRVLHAGQFGMNKMKAWQGSYGISPMTGIVSPAYFVFDLIADIDPAFFNLAIRTGLYVSYFYQASDGVRIGQWDLSRNRMKQIPFIIPSHDEQLRIVRFAADQTEKIDAAIAIKEEQVAVLTEYKTTLINAAVTGKIKVA